MSRLTQDWTAEPVSRDQILRHARGQGNTYFSCSVDHEQDWQPYPVDPYSAMCDDHTYIYTYTKAHRQFSDVAYIRGTSTVWVQIHTWYFFRGGGRGGGCAMVTLLLFSLFPYHRQKHPSRQHDHSLSFVSACQRETSTREEHVLLSPTK